MIKYMEKEGALKSRRRPQVKKAPLMCASKCRCVKYEYTQQKKVALRNNSSVVAIIVIDNRNVCMGAI